jgi:hypothetical protein
MAMLNVITYESLITKGLELSFWKLIFCTISQGEGPLSKVVIFPFLSKRQGVPVNHTYSQIFETLPLFVNPIHISPPLLLYSNIIAKIQPRLYFFCGPGTSPYLVSAANLRLKSVIGVANLIHIDLFIPRSKNNFLFFHPIKAH